MYFSWKKCRSIYRKTSLYSRVQAHMCVWGRHRKEFAGGERKILLPLLGIYLDKTFIEKDTCIPLFIPTLFTIAKTWKQPKCPSTNERIKKMWYIYTVEYHWTITKEKNNAICNSMEGTRDSLTKWSKSKRKTHTIYMISLRSGI